MAAVKRAGTAVGGGGRRARARAATAMLALMLASGCESRWFGFLDVFPSRNTPADTADPLRADDNDALRRRFVESWPRYRATYAYADAQAPRLARIAAAIAAANGGAVATDPFTATCFGGAAGGLIRPFAPTGDDVETQRRANRAMADIAGGDVNRGIAELQALDRAGYLFATVRLGLAHLHGRVLAFSPQLAWWHFDRAARSGCVFAQHMLGLMFRDGVAMPPDPAVAFFWLTLAASVGEQESSRERAALAAALPEAERQALEARAAAFRAGLRTGQGAYGQGFGQR